MKPLTELLKNLWPKTPSEAQVATPVKTECRYDRFHNKPTASRRELTVAPWALEEDLDRLDEEAKLEEMSIEELKIMAEEMFGLKFQKTVSKKTIISKIIAEVDK